MFRRIFRAFDPNATARHTSMVQMRIDSDRKHQLTVKFFRFILYLTVIVVFITMLLQGVQ